ncbi:hypothetical protein [Staphylococcus saprophyticus]|uniref:hypothetical protein n=1 Tax=Staphylococcus saprophyticus TaxID=29385 RepID=UPI0022EA7EFC|nr:hypothetical protein [Staphylococcus saprophyticus]
MENLGMIESLTEGKIVGGLNKEDKKKWKQLNIVSKKELIKLYKEDKAKFDLELHDVLDDTSSTLSNPDKIITEEEKDKLTKFFSTQGIYNPSSTTLNAFSKQDIMANFDRFYHAMGMLTLNMDKQANYNYHRTQQNQNFIQIAQNDTIIKNQEKQIEQNSKIINILQNLLEK